MKRITLLSATLVVAAATALGCSNKSTDKAMSETTAAETTMTESAAPVTAPDAKMAKVLVLKFHHDN